MSSEELSILVWCWHDPQTDTTKLRVVNVDTGEEVHLNDGTFLLRISIDAKELVTRLYIRHMVSGREAYVQGGQKLRAFIKDCLLSNPGKTNE